MKIFSIEYEKNKFRKISYKCRLRRYRRYFLKATNSSKRKSKKYMLSFKFLREFYLNCYL